MLLRSYGFALVRACLTAFALLSAPMALAAEWPDLPAQIRATDEGRADAAVIIAIEDYAKVDDVSGARANADAWFQWLVKGRGVPAARVYKAYDADATDIQIRELATRAAAAVQEGGTLWFVFIGHGAPSVNGKDGLLVGVDADRSAQGIYQRSVSRSELLTLLDAGAQASTVALIDACFSGQSADGAALVDGLQPLVPTALMAAASRRTHVLTAAGSGEFSGPLPGVARPAFSYLALGGLLGWADGEGDKDGRVSAVELRDYVSGALNVTVSGRTQTPALLGGDVVLARSAGARAPDLFALTRDGVKVGPRIELGGDDELLRLAEEAARKAEDRRKREQEEAQAVADLERARTERYDAAAREVRDAARRDFAAIAPLLTSGGPTPEALSVLDAFVRRYGAASVNIDGEKRGIEVPEVQRAREALGRSSRGAALGALKREHGGYVSVADIEAGFSDPLRIESARALRAVAERLNCAEHLKYEQMNASQARVFTVVGLLGAAPLLTLAATNPDPDIRTVGGVMGSTFGVIAGGSIIGWAMTHPPRYPNTLACLSEVPRAAVLDALSE